MGLVEDEATMPPYVRVRSASEIPGALRALGIRVSRPVLVSVGGAGGMAPVHLEAFAAVLEQLVPALDRWGGVVVDGGTDSGVMRAAGQIHEAAGARFPLVGVAAEGTVCLPGVSPKPHAARPDSRHSHLIVVPGEAWGDESPWLSRIASAIAGGQPSLTLVSNGGDICYDDIGHSLKAGRPVIVLAGTGRTADAIAAAISGRHERPDRRAARIARSAGVTSVAADDPQALVSAIESVLAPAD